MKEANELNVEADIFFHEITLFTAHDSWLSGLTEDAICTQFHIFRQRVCRRVPFLFSLAMAKPSMSNPTVYMFKEDKEIIKQLVAEHNGSETSGDLFGLWTEDNKAVIHLATGQSGRGTSSKSKDTLESSRKPLCENYGLPRIGKWHYQSDTKPKRKEIAEFLLNDKPLWKKDKVQYNLIIVANHENSDLSPYIVSKTSISSQGSIELLHGENPFRKLQEIRKIIGDSSVQNDGRNESQGDVTMNPADNESDNETRVTTYTNSLQAIPSETDSFGVEERTYESRPLPELTNFTANDLKVYMFEKDIEMVQKLVLRYPDLETGGDLFGLWTTEGDAVLHIVLGPGRNCSRTDVSFNQDIPYLQRNGEVLTENYMLGHIGEWHSHHQLRLFKPSQGDSSTVIRHFPRGAVYGFLLIIANIVAPHKVKLSPYLYTENSTFAYSRKGEVVPLKAQNVFKELLDIQDTIKVGKETKIDVRIQREQVARSRHYEKSVGVGCTRQGKPPKSTRSNAHRHNLIEPMEVDHDHNPQKSTSKQWKRY